MNPALACTVSALLVLALTSCQTSHQPSYPNSPTDSGSRYSNFTEPSSRMGEQNTDLED